MKKIFDPEQMRTADKTAIEAFGFPGIVLMEKAAMGLADAVMAHCGKKGALFFCGAGNNGGDGFAAARMLIFTGYPAKAVLLGKKDKLRGDAEKEMELLESCCGREVVEEITSEEALAALNIDAFDTVVDCIFGTGLDREVAGLPKAAIERINAFDGWVIACDLPSGVDGRTGKVWGCAVEADETVTFHAKKTGLCLYPGKQRAGKIRVHAIGLPPKVNELAKIEEPDRESVRELLPDRAPTSHKGTFGHGLIVGGSFGMAGAVKLAAGGALKSGIGLLTLAVPESVLPLINGDPMEAMCVAVDEKDGRMCQSGWTRLEAAMAGKNALGVGMGWGRADDAAELLRKSIGFEGPMLIDADGLFALAKAPEMLKTRKAETVLTPHPGEMARLTGLSIAKIAADPVGTAGHYAGLWNAVVVLKTAPAVIAAPDGRVSINPTGNAGMASGGSGDVLSGVIVSLLAQGLNAYDAARVGAYLHGKAGDAAAKEKGMIAMTGADLHEGLVSVCRSFR